MPQMLAPQMLAPISKFIRRFLDSEDGVTTVEYAVLLAMIIVAAIGAILNSGNVQAELWFSTSEQFNDAMPGSQL